MRRIPIAEIETVDPEVRDTTHFGKLGHLTARHTRARAAQRHSTQQPPPRQVPRAAFFLRRRNRTPRRSPPIKANPAANPNE